MPKFVPRQRKHKVLQRQKGAAHNGTPTIVDSNTTELLPASKAEKEARRQALRDELRAAQPQSKISRKKSKRLDKYIDTKLRKEENLALLKQLAQVKVDTSLLRSSKKLGRGRESKREVLGRAIREVRRGVDVERNEGLLFERREGEVEGESEEGDEMDGEEVEVAQALRSVQSQTPGSFGSGLKRPLGVDEEGRPVIKKRKRTKTRHVRVEAPQELEWEGFDTDSDGAGALASGSESGGESTYSEDDRSEVESGSDGTVEEDTETSMSEDEDGDDDGGSEDSPENSGEVRKERVSAFKAWATQQRNETLGFTPSTVITETITTSQATKPINFTPRPPEVDPLPPELESKTATDATRKAYHVHVERPLAVQEVRHALPVVAEEQKIMEAIYNNDAVIVCGATGSGKTTQVPQFLYEAGYGDPKGSTPGRIGVTQPRRVAAVSMSKRVGDELGDAKDKVSYQIRFESSASDKTTIKFMTDGVLLREVAQDFALIRYSAIIIDEAHERSVNTDILIGMMTRIVDLRKDMAQENSSIKPLKLIIMSATLRISDFTENERLFRKGPPPIIEAEGRQYPVTIHFARRTRYDYIEEAFRKVSRGHRQLPPGGMLVFLTGQNEISTLAKRLRQAFPSTSGSDVRQPPVRISAAEAPLETEDLELSTALDHESLRDHNEDSDRSDTESDIHGLDDDDDRADFDIGESPKDNQGLLKVHVLPLYSQLPTNQQLRVFEPPPEGSRLIVLATNVAETSLTIPGIKYVFDCGRAKEKKYDGTTGVQSFEVGWISKASANQRAGRAGRTGPGHCWRLYSSAVYERDFEEYAEPEILRTPIEGLVLQLKSMDLQHVINFPFPTPPDRQSLAKAEKLLTYLGALSQDGKITPVGRELSLYPLSPRFSRMLLIGKTHGVTAYTIALVAALAVPDIFIPENQLDLTDTRDNIDPSTNAPDSDDTTAPIRTESDNLAAHAREKRRKAFARAHALFSSLDRTSDALKLLSALCAYGHESPADADVFCAAHFLRPKALKEATQLREQLTAIVRMHKPGSVGPYQPRLPQPSAAQLKVLKQIVAAGFVDQVAIRADLAPLPPERGRKPKRAIDVPYLTLFPSHEGGRTAAAADNEGAEKFVYLHPSSVLAHTAPKDLPQYVVYSHLQRGTASVPGRVPKVRMHALTPVSGVQLAALAQGTPLLEYGKPVGKMVQLERQGGAERRECWVVPSLVGEKGSVAWPLPARRVVQRREGGRGWVVEMVVQ